MKTSFPPRSLPFNPQSFKMNCLMISYVHFQIILIQIKRLSFFVSFIHLILPISLFSFLPKYLKANPRPHIHLLASIYIYIRTLRGFLGGSEGKESTCSVGDLGLIAGLGRSPGEGHGNPLQQSRLENPMDRGAWWATVHGRKESDMTKQVSTAHKDFKGFPGSFPGKESTCPCLPMQEMLV